MKTMISALLALAFMLTTNPSHALNPLGTITVHTSMHTSGVTGYTLVAQCQKGTPAANKCIAAYRASNAAALIKRDTSIIDTIIIRYKNITHYPLRIYIGGDMKKFTADQLVNAQRLKECTAKC